VHTLEVVLTVTVALTETKSGRGRTENSGRTPRGRGLSANAEGGDGMVMLHGSMDGQPADRVLKTLQQDGYCLWSFKDSATKWILLVEF
jgi:hypothetical protein